MGALIQMIVAVIVSASMQMSMNNATEVPPQQIAAECMNGIQTMQEETLDRYADNSYVNFLDNLKGDDETVQRLRDALMKNFDYHIDETLERDGVAVSKITIHQCDFSKVLDKYEKKSYEYITEHLYDEDITDKKKLNARCLDIYVSQVEAVAKAGKTQEETIYLPMTGNGHNSWNVLLEEDTMEAILGDIAIPDSAGVGQEDEEKKEQ